MVRLASSCAWNVPSRLRVKPFRQFRRRQRFPDRADDLRHVGAAVGVGQHHDAAAAVLAQDLVRPFGFLDVGELPRRNPADRGFDQEVAQPLRGAQPVRQPHRDVEPAVAVDDARHHAPIRQPAELLDHGRRLHAVERGAAVIDADFELRNQDLLFDLKIGEPGMPPTRWRSRFRRGAQRVEIVAEDLQRDLGAHAGQHVIEPMRDRLADVDRHREDREPRRGSPRSHPAWSATDGFRSTSISDE